MKKTLALLLACLDLSSCSDHSEATERYFRGIFVAEGIVRSVDTSKAKLLLVHHDRRLFYIDAASSLDVDNKSHMVWMSKNFGNLEHEPIYSNNGFDPTIAKYLSEHFELQADTEVEVSVSGPQVPTARSFLLIRTQEMKQSESTLFLIFN